MLFWTHLILGLFGLLVWLPRVENKWVFLIVGLIASVLPDMDSSSSKLGRKNLSKVITAFTKHRGVMHSFTFAFFIYFILRLLLPIAALPFLIGYLIHLVSDCFTKQGLRLFYPMRWRAKGIVRSGGLLEIVIFIIFFIADMFLLAAMLLN